MAKGGFEMARKKKPLLKGVAKVRGASQYKIRFNLLAEN